MNQSKNQYIGRVMWVLLCFICASITAVHAAAPVMLEARQRTHPEHMLKAAVASQSAVASEIGAQVLKQGGNAVDAAVAIAFAETVTLPRAGNLGGGGFMLLWLHDQQKAVAIDYRETAPAAATPDMFVGKDGAVDYQRWRTSYLASGVPGTVAGLWLAHQKYGQLPWKSLLQPAIELAAGGVEVGYGMAQALAASAEHLRDGSAKQVFVRSDGSPYQVGDRMKRPALARTLRLVAEQGHDGFYAGAVAEKIAEANKKYRGLITMEDLKGYQAKLREPVEGTYRDYRVISMPPPSSGGVTLLELLNIWEHVPLDGRSPQSAKRFHLLTEAMNLAYLDRNKHLADPDFVTHMPLQRLLSKDYAKHLYATINAKSHTPTAQMPPLSAAPESRETTHVSVIDSDGNMVSNTYTLNYSFGNGRVIPGTGILMNNEMLDFTASVGVANEFGLVQGANNAIAPGKRPLSSMTPVLVLDHEGQPFLVTGSPGGSRIISTVLQCLLQVLDDGYNIAAATAAPRIHSQAWPDHVAYEQGVSPDTLALLAKMGHKLQPSDAMGSLQTVARQGGMVVASSDTRRIGAGVAGY